MLRGGTLEPGRSILPRAGICGRKSASDYSDERTKQSKSGCEEEGGGWFGASDNSDLPGQVRTGGAGFWGIGG